MVPTEIEKVDVYTTMRPNAPMNVFIHGGAWRAGRSADSAYLSETFVDAGAHFVAVDFNNVIETNGDLMTMADQVRRAVAWVYRNASSFRRRSESALRVRCLVGWSPCERRADFGLAKGLRAAGRHGEGRAVWQRDVRSVSGDLVGTQ